VIYIATNHFRDARWVDIQLRHLARHTGEPYEVHATVVGIDQRHRARFDHVIDNPETPIEPGTRSQGRMLTVLAEEIARQSDPDDLLVFMHGDAFPIADWVAPVRRMLAERPLAAVRRDENLEPTPHECFCATTVGFWTEIGGSWMAGPAWDFRGRPVTDTSGSLWANLESRGIEWHPILRTNAANLHPVWFAVYGDIVYHHGAGFRTPMSRRDFSEYMSLPVPLRNAAGVTRRLANRYASRKMYRRIARDDDFHLALTGEPK
jgi:hypothetical protein